MKIKPIDQKKPWEEFLLNYQPNSPLQAWNWGEFARKQGRQVFRLGLYDGDKLVGVSLFTKVTSRRGDYLECHGGPLINWGQKQVFERLLEYLKNVAKAENVHFLRIRPPLFHDRQWVGYFQQLGFVLAPMYFQAEHTLHLALSPSEEELLAGMRKNTRYGIGRAVREKVVVHQFDCRTGRTNPKGLEEALHRFFQLYKQTVVRQGFVPYDFVYFKNELEAFLQDDQAALFLAEWKSQSIAGAIVLFYGGVAYYHHGASAQTKPDVFGSYAVQWAAIQEAKRRGCKIYDFWGVAPADADKNHPRQGLSFFKEGFGGDRVRWLHTLDLPVHWRYLPLYLFVKWERWRRHL